MHPGGRTAARAELSIKLLKFFDAQFEQPFDGVVKLDASLHGIDEREGNQDDVAALLDVQVPDPAGGRAGWRSAALSPFLLSWPTRAPQEK